jgi:hypothetical protein
MSVSFTHIVKAAEPVLSVMLSWPLMGEVYSLPVYLSLLPIVAGCSLSAMKEVSLNMSGLSGAMISNVGMVLRNIYSKKSLNNYVIDGINLCAPHTTLPPPQQRCVLETSGSKAPGLSSELQGLCSVGDVSTRLFPG